jgi:hypothetical protein
MSAISACRICKSARLTQVLDLGNTAFTGVFPATVDEHVDEGRLNLLLCVECGLVQLGDSFPPDVLYGENYGYRSGLNSSMLQHLARTAHRLESRAGLKSGDVVLDIGSNDGSLLRSYRTRGTTLIGVDPTIAKFREFYDDALRLARSVFAGEADIVLGSRFLGLEPRGMPRGRKLVVRCVAWLARVTNGLVLTDTHNGLRAMNRTTVDAIRLTDNRMSHASQLLRQVSKSGLRYKEAPVEVLYSDYSLGKGQKLSGGILVLWDLISGRLP